MKRATILAVLVMLVSVGACGDPSFPPEACGALDDTEVFIGEQELVALCFQDPDGDAVTVTATASDPGVVEAVVDRGNQGVLLLTGKDAGRAVITVIARDSKGLSSDPQMFEVTVPNRAPEAKALPEITLTNDAPEASLTLTEYFTDPDGHPLAFSAAVSDETVIRASVTDNILRVEPVGHGAAEVRLVATDPHGLSASADAKVRLRLVVELLTDEFETLSADWEWNREGPAEIVDGRLKLALNGPGQLGIVSHAVDRSTDWTVTMNAEYVTDNSWPGLMIVPERVPGSFLGSGYIVVLFGGEFKRLSNDPWTPETNLLITRHTGVGWLTRRGWSGWFDEIAGKDMPMNVGVRVDAESLKVLVDDAVIHAVPDLRGVGIEAVALVVWSAIDVETFDGPEQTYFDRIRVTGIPTGASPTAQRHFPSTSSVRIIR